VFNTAAFGFANHLLAGEDWARQRLLAFSGQTAELQFGYALLRFTISKAGLLEEADVAAGALVSIRLADDAPVRALADRPSLFSSATVAGSAEFAETLGFVFRNLRWDVEHDLALLTGDVFARRALHLAVALGRWQGASARNLATSIAEYLTEEEAALVPRRALASFCSDVDALRDDLARLEKRVDRLAPRRC